MIKFSLTSCPRFTKFKPLFTIPENVTKCASVPNSAYRLRAQ